MTGNPGAAERMSDTNCQEGREGICLLIEEMLGSNFPDNYKSMLINGRQGSGSTSLSFSWELDSILGATEFLRAARPDLKENYVVLCFEGNNALCLDLSDATRGEKSSVVTIDLAGKNPPHPCHDSLEDFLAHKTQAVASVPVEDQDEWFSKGLARLDVQMQKLSFSYRHDKGGQIPRSHLWRPYRFCVQDIILGITVIRHNRIENCLDVDVFLTASIPEYEPDSGCRALALILLADAYKSGGSMEIRFTRHVEGGQIPRELFELSAKHGVHLSGAGTDQITASEARLLFMALSGFKPEMVSRIKILEDSGRLSAASVCYAMHHGVWSVEEIEIILALSHNPETILAGGPGPELWHLFHHDLLIGRTAMFGSYLDRHLLCRDHQPATDDGTDIVIELEDDERLVTISFTPDYCVKTYEVSSSETPISLSWLDGWSDFSLTGGSVMHVLLRARDTTDLRVNFQRDLEQAGIVSAHFPEDIVAIMVPADFHRLAPVEKQRFRQLAGPVGIVVCPEFVHLLDQGVWKRFDAVKVMRK